MPAGARDDEFTMAEVASHRGASSCWIVLRGEVYDFTEFAAHHPGGERALLRHAGTDASDAFAELHSQSLFAAFAPRYRIGRLAGAAPLTAGWPGVPPSSRFWEGLPPHEPINPLGVVLPSPFPHREFNGTGLETFRFAWASADRLLRLGEEDGAPTPPPDDGVSLAHIHRQKSQLSVLNVERDWLHVGEPAQYAREMRQKEAMLLGPRQGMGYVSTPESVEAEREVLELVLAFVLREHPDRFALLEDGAVIETLTVGYRRRFALAVYEERPLLLAGLLVQEDFCLLEEQSAALPTPLPEDRDGRDRRKLGFAYGETEFKEDHPSGRQHVMLSACCCFTFPAANFHKKSMVAIHHPGVNGWWYHLQRGMNRLFAGMTPSVSYFRHNFGFSGDETLSTIGGGRSSSSSAPRPAAEAEAAHESRMKTPAAPAATPSDATVTPRDSAFIRANVSHTVEFQTVRRLPQTQFVLFTVRTYVDRMAKLDQL